MTGVKASENTPLPDSKSSIEAYRKEYAEADAFCQKVQDFISEAGIPAMNELRNAGHHFLRSLNDSGKVVDSSELIRATNHAKRACYEAGEAGILIALDEIRNFKLNFRGIRIGEAIPDYIDMMVRAERARESVLVNRANGENRDQDHALRMSAFDELREICRTLDIARPECEALASQAVMSGRRFVTGLAMTLLGIVVTIAIAVIGWAYFT